MKTQRLLAAVMVGLALSAASGKADIVLDLSNIPGGSIQFNGAAKSFQINPIVPASPGVPSPQMSITTSGASEGLLAWITGGPWSYGPITGEHAPVSGGGVLTIQDGSTPLTGNLLWENVASPARGFETWNTEWDVNVTGITYSGSNPDLQALAGVGEATLVVSSQFVVNGKPMNLTALSTGSGPYRSSYSVTLTAVPEASTWFAGAGALALLLGFGAKVHAGGRRVLRIG